MQLLKFTPAYHGRYSIRLFFLAGLTAIFLVGCGDASTAKQVETETGLHGKQTVTIHIPDMGKRLELM